MRPAGLAGGWATGLLLLVLSLPIHLIEVWRDYPAWYHVVYLTLLVPVTGAAGRSGGTSFWFSKKITS